MVQDPARPVQDDYVLGGSDDEHARLRAQSRVWEHLAARVLDTVGIPEGGSCLDAGCGPGETMRLMAHRVGTGGRVVGVDVDERVGTAAITTLHSEGLSQCEFLAEDLFAGTSTVTAAFDLVYARFLLFHLPDKQASLARLWSLVRPGGHLVVQDYVMIDSQEDDPPTSLRDWTQVMNAVFGRVGIDAQVGLHLPELFRAAGVGPPDGTDVSSRMDPLRTIAPMLLDLFHTLGPAAISLGLMTTEQAQAWPAAFERDLDERGDRTALWPLVATAWRTRPLTEQD